MAMKKTLQFLFEHKSLDREQAYQLMIDMAEGKCNEAEMAACMTVYQMRHITIDEMLGFRAALLDKAVKPALEQPQLMDIVGTGGDGKNTFNISTLACFIVAGAGVTVAKHGNYGASSISGASNVMENLGYRFKNDASALNKELDRAGICFLHAPLFHPALKTVAGIRKQLGFRTLFNMLGPMVNPALPQTQVVGVYNLEMARIYQYLLQSEAQSFTIVHSLDGYDEISLTADTKIITQAGEKVLSPLVLGKRWVSPADIYGGNTTAEAAAVFKKIIEGEGSWAQNAVVLANAAVALQASGRYDDYSEAYAAAVESLESGKAAQALKTLISLQAA
jgi:anthranilate phosphoribosyltransferase